MSPSPNGHRRDTVTPPAPDYRVLLARVEDLERTARTALANTEAIIAKLDKSERRAHGYDTVAFETATGILNALKALP